jgi:hypothetical protein
MQGRANLPIRLQLADLALGSAGALFAQEHAVNGDPSFRLTKRADNHGYLITARLICTLEGVECQYFI